MATKIEYLDETLNVTSGCTPDFPCYANCYARRKAEESPYLRGKHGYDQDNPFQVTLHPDKLQKPYKWTRKPRIIGLSFMGDLFNDQVPDSYIKRVFEMVAENPLHIFLMLTRRSYRMVEYTQSDPGIFEAMMLGLFDNLWFGVSCSNENEKVNLHNLALVESPNRFLSYEPIKGPITLDGLTRKPSWVILGGETGNSANPSHPRWIRNMIEICKTNEIPVWFKGWGEWAPSGMVDGRLYNHSSGKPDDIGGPFHVFADGVQMTRFGQHSNCDYIDGKRYHEYPEAIRRMTG